MGYPERWDSPKGGLARTGRQRRGPPTRTSGSPILVFLPVDWKAVGMAMAMLLLALGFSQGAWEWAPRAPTSWSSIVVECRGRKGVAGWNGRPRRAAAAATAVSSLDRRRPLAPTRGTGNKSRQQSKKRRAVADWIRPGRDETRRNAKGGTRLPALRTRTCPDLPCRAKTTNASNVVVNSAER
jgi:hypothetical protein